MLSLRLTVMSVVAGATIAAAYAACTWGWSSENCSDVTPGCGLWCYPAQWSDSAYTCNQQDPWCCQCETWIVTCKYFFTEEPCGTEQGRERTETQALDCYQWNHPCE
jgi:hypothetical protein